MTSSDDPLREPAVPRLGLSVAVILVIAVGGALGTLARFLLDTAFVEGSGHFPTVTLVINLSGSLAIGLLVPVVGRWSTRQPLLRPFVVIGILGGWTTYSALAVSGITLLQSGHAAVSFLYLAATFAVGTSTRRAGRCGRSAVGSQVTAFLDASALVGIDDALPYPGTCVVGCGSRSGRRGTAPHHPPRCSSSPRPVAGWDIARQCLRVVGLGLPHGNLDVSRVRPSRSRCGRDRLCGASPRGPPPVGSRCISFGTATAQRRGCTPSAGSRSALLSPQAGIGLAAIV